MVLVLIGVGMMVCLGLVVIDSSTEQADGHVRTQLSPSQGSPRSGTLRLTELSRSWDVTASRVCPQAQCIWTCQGATSLGVSSLEFRLGNWPKTSD